MYTCKTCSLPDNYPDIHIGQNGSCNYCQFYEEHKSILTDYDNLESVFLNYLAQAKETAAKNGSRYDCLVGFSGGKDSTYIIYQLKEKYNMRVLAFTYDNGFYVHELYKTCFQEISADKYFTVLQGKEWTGDDVFDDYCQELEKMKQKTSVRGKMSRTD